MMKCFWLTSFVFCCCLTVRSQQPGEAIDTSGSNRKGSTRSNGAVFLNFSAAVREFNKVWLQWDVDSTEDGDYFIIERATDGEHFETIGALRKTGNNNHYELTELAPPNGTDLYRVKYTGQEGKTLYTKAI